MSEPLLESKKPPSEASEEASAKLEEILCDTTLSCWLRFRKAIGIELKYLFRLAGPAIIVYVLNSVISMSTQIFCGHVGNLELAASSLGNNGIQLLAYGLMHPAPARRIPTGGLCVRAVRIRPEYRNLRVRCQFPYTEVLAGAKHCECQCVYISRDAGVAHLFDMAGVFVYILTSERCKATWSGFSWMAFNGLWDFFKLSAASAVMLCLETWYFQILVLIAGLLPDPEIALDSLAVCVTIVGWAITISTGFNAAVRGDMPLLPLKAIDPSLANNLLIPLHSVRVSNELGAKHPKSAAFSVVLSTGTSFIISVIFAFITLVLRHQLSYAFTSGEVVSDAVADLTPLLAASIILNGIQPVLSGNYT
ncbi:UNVERIFIED_CONTAM: protein DETOXIFICATION 40 [Sesamum calycinum]|uniref:Protein DETOXIFICATION 40 n=1 Tax=Sesamum calycinum TaxID=2727403 RepID=A0AAW2Q3Y1_9LAMI